METRVAVLIIKDNKILLAKHKKNSHFYFVLPGGHLEKHESIEGCGKRELREETNLNIKSGQKLWEFESRFDDRVVKDIVLKGRIISGNLMLGKDPEDKGENRLADVAWFTKQEFKKLNFKPYHLMQKILDSWV